MERFIEKPNIELHLGVVVHKDTDIEFKNDNVEQTIKDLVLHSITKVVGEGYESTYDTTINLEEGDVLLFEEEQRGYIKPVQSFVSVEEAIETLECIK